jgi:hypothetical protein
MSTFKVTMLPLSSGTDSFQVPTGLCAIRLKGESNRARVKKRKNGFIGVFLGDVKQVAH